MLLVLRVGAAVHRALGAIPHPARVCGPECSVLDFQPDHLVSGRGVHRTDAPRTRPVGASDYVIPHRGVGWFEFHHGLSFCQHFDCDLVKIHRFHALAFPRNLCMEGGAFSACPFVGPPSDRFYPDKGINIHHLTGDVSFAYCINFKSVCMLHVHASDRPDYGSS